MIKGSVLRVLLIALMAVCGNISLFAAIKTGDIVTIKSGDYYLTVNANKDAINNTPNDIKEPTENSLWVVTINKQGNYSFALLGNNQKCLSYGDYKNQNKYALKLGNNASVFTLEDQVSSENSLRTRLKYTYKNSGKDSTRYVQYSYLNTTNGYQNFWRTTGADKVNEESTKESNIITIEKWGMVTRNSGLKGEFEKGDVEFRWAESDASAARQSITRKFTITSTSAETYYDCLNTAEVEKVGREETKPTGTPNVKSISFAFANKGQYNCAVYTDATVKNRTLLTVSSEPQSDENNAKVWNVTITPVGSSPMELHDGDSWMDFTNNLVASYGEEGDANQTNYKTYLPVKRRSYHREALPEFEVSVTPGNCSFSKAGGDVTFSVTCKHQHGEVIKHMYGLLAGNSSDEEYTYATVNDGTFKATSAFATFTAKNVSDETTATWLTVGTLNEGEITLTASVNNTGSARKARLVGVFNYVTNDETDTHFTSVNIPIIQRYKDGRTVLVPNKGHSGDALVNQPYLKNEYEQQVHTVNKTIYYLPDQDSIELRLQEPTFRRYLRWYDYETGCNPRLNANPSDRTEWVTAPKLDNYNTNFSEINNDFGNSYGLYIVYGQNGSNVKSNVPVLKGWSDGKAHVIACDVSAHTDYNTISDDTIIEPTLSYRQVFHLKPASEMAAKLCSLSQAGKYMETYRYMVPTEQVLMLSTEFRYQRSIKETSTTTSKPGNQQVTTTKITHINSKTECCYFYNKGATTIRIDDGCVWYRNGTEINKPTYGTKDYLQVAAVETPETTATYQLRLPKEKSGLSYDLLIAEFQVTYVDNATHGPVNSETGGHEIISYENIAAHYQILEYNDFSYGASAPGTSDVNQHSGKHLPWSEATYGFYYPDLADCDRQNSGQGTIPYYGEYALINYMQGGGNNGWGKGEQHGGATNGYALYVDGTQEPGLVASISTGAEICSGQTMYCSMWLMNPRSGSNNDAVNPIFRCNIQGRKLKTDGTYSEWEDAGVYYVGEVGQSNHLGTGWQQIVFPVKSDISYDETRVQIYNFGTGGTGNDFLLDDICLYASPLPLATYHETTGCTSYADSETTNTVVVVRIDYSQLKELNNTPQVNSRADYVYYQIVDVTTTDSVVLKLKDENNLPMYHNDNGTKSEEYGSIAIPATVTNELKKTSVDILIDELTASKVPSGKCFVYDDATNKWYLYLVQVIPNGDDGDRDKYLDRDRSYILRVAYNANELSKAACVFTSPLLAKQDTYLELRSEKFGTQRVNSCMEGLCANNHHFMDLKVSNAIASTVGGALQTYESLVHADWLKGFAGDDVYCGSTALTQEQKTTADATFESNYGYTRAAVKSAIVAMRKVGGANYVVDNVDDLRVDGDFDADKLALIRDLCNRGLLQLYQQTVMFYLGSDASARYWVFPLAEDAKVVVNGNLVTLQDCDEPKWVKVTSEISEYGVNLSPIDYENLTEHQRLDIPTIRVIEGTTSVTIPMTDLLGSTVINSGLLSGNNLTFNVHNPTEGVLEYVDLSNNKIEILDAPNSFELGKEYLMRMAFYDKDGNVFIKGVPTECRVGYVYFYLMFAPRINTWTGAKTAIWGDDRNWSGGCVPLRETNVIIPVLSEDKPYPIVMTGDAYPLDVNYESNVCNHIYIASGATILNQHLLQYNRAFVDMQVPATAWNTMAAPMKGMYTGDIYIPHEKNNFNSNTNKESSDPFVVSGFQGARTSSAPYAFWQSFYNKRVHTQHENGNTSSAISTNTAAFARTNSLAQELTPGMGFQVLGYGPTNSSNEVLMVRLPKPDNTYYYYKNDGTQSDQQVSVTHSSKLAFEPDANGDMRITLSNDQASEYFMFGNPTMAYVDMKAFLEANSSVLNGAYYTMINGTWNADSKEFSQEKTDGLLAPMRSVLIKVKSSASSVTVTLSASHLRQSDGTAAAMDNGAAFAPRRKTDDVKTNIMTIYAYNEKGQAQCTLADRLYANNQYVVEEDALFISSGVEKEVDDQTAFSPINMYTVSERVPMMIDVRQEIDTVPIAMLVKNGYRTNKVKFAFYLSLNWDKECYFHDSFTGERYRIMDGLWLEVDMPENHEPRYFITGPDKASKGDIVTSTDNLNVGDAAYKIWAYAQDNSTLVVASNDIIKSVNVYDLTGKVVATKVLGLQYNSTAVNVPAGVYVVEATMRDNSKQFTQTVVW